MRAVLVFSHALVAAGLVACISDPSFQQVSGAADSTTTNEPTLTAAGDAPDMVVVPATTITRRSTQASVVVPAFWMDVAPVSAGAYQTCVSTASCALSPCGGSGDVPVACVTRSQAASYCAWKGKRLVRNDEWTAATIQKPAGLTGLSGGNAEWVDADTAAIGIARGGASAGATTSVGLASSMPSIGFRCAKNR